MTKHMEEAQEKTIEEIQKEAQEYLNGWKRAKADFLNYQKQVERERAEWAMFANASCVKAMLSVLDSLEMAAQSVISSGARNLTPSIGQGERSLTGVRDDGLRKIRDQMLDALRSMGVEAVKSVGEPVNPEFHEVVATEKSEAHASGLIIKEAQRGYTMHGKVLRPSKVIVAE